MLSSKLSMIINSCDKFSDLWDAHIYYLEKNWHDRKIETLLVTDSETDKCYKNVRIVSTGDGYELPDRLGAVLSQIETEYILITLDDYFPIYPIESKKIEHLVEEMEALNLDYIRLFKRPDSINRLTGSDHLYEIDLWSKKDSNYQVNLYVGIWRKTFLEKMIRETLNAWEFELSLTGIAREVNAKCAMSKDEEFKTLDVVRKGKLLRKANRYLEKQDTYHGNREVISIKEELRINVFTFIKGCMPQTVIDAGKSILRKKGFRFYSDGNKTK